MDSELTLPIIIGLLFLIEGMTVALGCYFGNKDAKRKLERLCELRDVVRY